MSDSTKINNNASAGSSKQKKQPVKAVSQDATQTIRAQSKKDKSKTNNPQDVIDRSGMSKEVVKAVLASPLTVAWPNIPRHLQNATLHALKELIPSEIADYHVSRARCHQREKRIKRKISRKDKTENPDTEDSAALESTEKSEDISMVEDVNKGFKRSSSPSSTEPLAKKPRLISEQKEKAEDKEEETEMESVKSRPVQPEMLSHMVLGINEVIKTLESQISDLRIRLCIIGEALNGKSNAGQGSLKGVKQYQSHLLPTAPRSPSPEADIEEDDYEKGKITDDNKKNPLEFIVVPLLSINPPSLVSPIPQYCATYNALIYQHQQLTKICKTRLKANEVEGIIGSQGEEVRVVPLGAVEKDIAELVGLRRVACLGLRSSHPSMSILRNLLPKSILHSPRHSITLPIPTSTLQIHNDSSNRSNEETKAKPKSAMPLPNIHYADLHIKGIKTKVPVDNAARKARRLEEVRKKRVESKMKRKEFREKAKKR
ncbi:uncharacterized protein L201_000459 [Kwoniella dendrophila CBS 6074]|uniref:Uncharacterized protein n=1 Tax=Kwoniella dendrophila CBS 6074 TaxID=1295534 RepID=A0AAX4JM11_9TREE